MRRHAKLRNSLILIAASAMLCLPMSASADTRLKAKLVEQNGSGVTGTVSLTALDNGGLKVVIHSQGLVPDQPRPTPSTSTGRRTGATSRAPL